MVRQNAKPANRAAPKARNNEQAEQAEKGKDNATEGKI